MTREEFLKIEGMEEVLKEIPDFKWSMLTKLLTVQWSIRNFDFVLASEDRKVEIMISSFMGTCEYLAPLSLKGSFGDFDIVDISEDDEHPMFEIIDHADNGIHIKCSSIIATPYRLAE